MKLSGNNKNNKNLYDPWYHINFGINSAYNLARNLVRRKINLENAPIRLNCS